MWKKEPAVPLVWKGGEFRDRKLEGPHSASALTQLGVGASLTGCRPVAGARWLTCALSSPAVRRLRADRGDPRLHGLQ